MNYLDYFLVIFPLVINSSQRERVQIMKRDLNLEVVRVSPNIFKFYYFYLGQELHIGKGFYFRFKSAEQRHVVVLSD